MLGQHETALAASAFCTSKAFVVFHTGQYVYDWKPYETMEQALDAANEYWDIQRFNAWPYAQDDEGQWRSVEMQPILTDILS